MNAACCWIEAGFGLRRFGAFPIIPRISFFAPSSCCGGPEFGQESRISPGGRK